MKNRHDDAHITLMSSAHIMGIVTYKGVARINIMGIAGFGHGAHTETRSGQMIKKIADDTELIAIRIKQNS